MTERCEKCGLPPDLCPCGEIKKIGEKFANLGIISPHRFYRCTKCDIPLPWSAIEHSTCPCCMRPLMRHRGCGGIVVAESNEIPRIY